MFRYLSCAFELIKFHREKFHVKSHHSFQFHKNLTVIPAIVVTIFFFGVSRL